MPFVVLPKTCVAKHFVFESRWNAEVIQKRVTCSMEMYSDREPHWRKIGEWEFSLDPSVWVYLAREGGAIVCPLKGALEFGREVHPPDLHKYTGPKEPIPEQGLFPGPSYLNFKDKRG
jgi:hypothetical protein